MDYRKPARLSAPFIEKAPTPRQFEKIGRNDPCPCGSGRKWKRCHKNSRKHAEGFCLMTYRSEDGAIEEKIWNSRDGVTPFVIDSADGRTHLRHVDWQKDEYLPNFVPPLGSRVFIDMTDAIAAIAEAEVRRAMNDPSSAHLIGLGLDEAKLRQLVRRRDGSPAVTVVDQSFLDELYVKRHGA